MQSPCPYTYADLCFWISFSTEMHIFETSVYANLLLALLAYHELLKYYRNLCYVICICYFIRCHNLIHTMVPTFDDFRLFLSLVNRNSFALNTSVSKALFASLNNFRDIPESEIIIRTLFKALDVYWQTVLRRGGRIYICISNMSACIAGPLLLIY